MKSKEIMVRVSFVVVENSAESLISYKTAVELGLVCILNHLDEYDGLKMELVVGDRFQIEPVF